MASPIIKLDTDELLSALDVINPVGLLVDELAAKAPGGAQRPACPNGRLTPWRGTRTAAVPAGEFMLLEDMDAGGQCVLPTSALYVFRTAALAALAARELVAPGVVTAAVLGSGFAAQTSLTLIARQLPGLSHVAVCPTGDELDRPLEPRVIDQLDLAGVGWLVTTAVAEAVFGATLIAATVARARWWLEIGQLSKGAVLINTTGEDLSDDLVDAVDQIYVDDASLIEDNSHRYFARTHLAGPNGGSTSVGRTDGRRNRRIEADLAQVLTGAHAGRTHVDHILLVELLGTTVLDVRLACSLHRAALEQGLGVRLTE